MDIPSPPEDQELRNVIDKLAQFVARNGPEFEKMTMEKQKDNHKFSFLFGGEYFSYYKYKLAMEQQTEHSILFFACLFVCAEVYNPGAKDVVDIPPPPMPMIAPPLIPPPSAPAIDELIQQSQWNLQQQEQHLHTLRQEQVTAAITLAMEQQTQKLLLETQLDITEFDNLLQPIIDTCTKDAISAGKNWMFNNAKTPQHCELMTSHLRNRITADTAHFELRLHLIYLTNDVLHHCQRKQQKDLLAALQKVVVPIYCTSFLAVEEEKQQKITRLLLLWEKNGYFDEETIQQLQNPALGLGQYQASLITEYAAVVQPVQLAFQQQIQALKTQHDEFVASLKQQHQSQPQSAPVGQLAAPAEPEKPPPMTTQADVKLPMSGPPPGEFDGSSSRPPDPSNPSGPSDIPPTKPAWYDPQHMSPWNPNQPPPFDPNQPPPPCPPWNSHEGMWNDQRDPGNWSGGPGREGGPWSGPGGSEHAPPSWNSYDQQPPWGNQPDQPPWGQREPPFPPRMQRPPHFRGPFPPHQQPPPFNQPPPPPHGFGRFPPRFMQEDFSPRHHYDRPPYTPHRFDYAQGEYPGDMPGPPPHHHPNQRLPPPGLGADHPPWGGGQHPEFGPPPHGFNGHSPHMRHRQHPVQDDPSLVPNVPYFDLPAGLMAPLVKLEDCDYKPLDPKDIRLPPPMPPSDRLLAAVEAFYSPPSHDRPRNSEGWEQNGLYEFFRAKMRARRKKDQEKRNSGRGGSRSRSRSRSRGRSSSGSSSHSSKSSRSRSRSSRSRSHSRSRSYSRSRSLLPSVSFFTTLSSYALLKKTLSCSVMMNFSRAFCSSTAVLGATSSKLPADTRLGEENKGHQLLMKMGWSGSGGLGAKEQGIQDPIKGGDIRDKWDQYKGVGVSLDDPYENYRRNKSYNFVARMKAREEVNREPQDAPSTD
uniref:Calcium homeostasis endoplasmic reticulum protein n=1 Tax=Oreochromis niloticus TaxID=8128 RepID=A0A669DT88_ORENI